MTYYLAGLIGTVIGRALDPILIFVAITGFQTTKRKNKLTAALVNCGLAVAISIAGAWLNQKMDPSASFVGYTVTCLLSYGLIFSVAMIVSKISRLLNRQPSSNGRVNVDDQKT